MTPLTLFEMIDPFISRTRICHHIEIAQRGIDRSQVWFTMHRPYGSMTCLVFDENIHGREKVLEMVEKVSSHTMWHNWAIEAISERGLFDSVTVATIGMVDIRHSALPEELRPDHQNV